MATSCDNVAVSDFFYIILIFLVDGNIIILNVPVKYRGRATLLQLSRYMCISFEAGVIKVK